jgi:sec-independent protein translocase protein TatA
MIRMLPFAPTLGYIWSPGDMIVILVVALLVFGKRLPEVARSLGKSIQEFKKGMSDVTDDMMRQPVEPQAPRQVAQAAPAAGGSFIESPSAGYKPLPPPQAAAPGAPAAATPAAPPASQTPTAGA